MWQAQMTNSATKSHHCVILLREQRGFSYLYSENIDDMYMR